MSNKPWNKCDPLDRALKSLCPPGPANEGVQIRIELRCGFEAFNTRPYHNYETWGHGWTIDGLGVQVTQEDLDDAVRVFVERVSKLQAGDGLKPWERGMVRPQETGPLKPGHREGGSQ